MNINKNTVAKFLPIILAGLWGILPDPIIGPIDDILLNIAAIVNFINQNRIEA